MEPIATFYRILPEAVMPMRADRSALGTLPVAALQYCEPVTTASALGWYAFPPISFHVQWDGNAFIWTPDEGDTWYPVRSEHAPGFSTLFDQKAPEDLRGMAPPMITAVPQPGVLQIWTGIMLRTRQGWSALIRPPANLSHSREYEAYEGMIETDQWFYPLFSNVRIMAIDKPIFFDQNRPFVQVQVLKRDTCDEDTLRSAAFLDGLDSLSDRDWAEYRTKHGERGMNPMMSPGRYARDIRKSKKRSKADESSGG